MAERDRGGRDPGDAGGFLGRWSRRKAEARRAEQGADDDTSRPHPDAPASGADAGAGEGAASERGGEVEPVDPSELPDIDSLHRGSDFKVFMRPGVPPELRTQALRRLWRVDPSFSKLDGLVEYGEDYTVSKRPRDAIRTAYQVGRGFVNRLEEEKTAEPPPPAASDAGEPTPSGPGDAPAIAATETASGAPHGTAGAPSAADAGREVHAEPARPEGSDEPADSPERRRRRPLPRRS